MADQKFQLANVLVLAIEGYRVQEKTKKIKKHNYGISVHNTCIPYFVTVVILPQSLRSPSAKHSPAPV